LTVAAPERFSEQAIRRWSRQILLAEVGGGGQRRLLASRLRVVGAGPAAVVCASYLRAAGVTLAEDATDAVAAPQTPAGPDAFIQGAFAAVEAEKRILGIGQPASGNRLELPR
jgi:hypothetical protein